MRTAQSLSDPPNPSQPSHALYVGTGVVTPLVLVAFRCRHRKVRRQAISLLHACKRREGLWDSDVAAEAAEWIVAFEEEGADEKGWIPEAKRVRFVSYCDGCAGEEGPFEVFGWWDGVRGEVVRETSLVWRCW